MREAKSERQPATTKRLRRERLLGEHHRMSRLDGYHRGADFDIAVNAPGRNERQGVEPEMLRHPHRRHASSTRLLILRDQLRKRVAIAPRPTDHYTNPHDGHAKRATSGRPKVDQPRTVHSAHHRASRRARLPAPAQLRATE